MNKFKIGDKVKMSESGLMKWPIGRGFTNPENTEGEVVNYNTEHHCRVQWSNGFENSYRNSDLVSTELKVTYGFSGDTVTLYFEGKMHSIPSSDPAYQDLVDHLTSGDHDKEVIEELVNKPKMLERKSEGLVTVDGDTVYYKGNVVHSTLTLKLLEMFNEGLDTKPWAKFLENLMENPSFKSRASLYNFLEHFSAPITPEGKFLAYKRVRGNYFDLHSNTMDNSPGNVVTMPRSEVDDDSNRTCSSGLHACASSYLGSFYSNSSDAKVVVVEIDPRNVVAVPVDYSFSKMRVCEYKVLGDADEKMVERLDGTVYTSEFEDLTEEEEFERWLWGDTDDE